MKGKGLRSAVTGIAAGTAVFLGFGIPSALIPLGIYTRMIDVTPLDFIFLFISSALIGVYAGIWSHLRWQGDRPGKASALGGGASSFLAVSCPICNVILVSLLGFSTVMFFVEPLRPIFGVAGITLLGAAVYYNYRSLRGCRNCGKGKSL